jgi:serine/threonine-protein kinase ATR
MQDEPESRKRKLRLRTYSVVCLNEECGILEWVPNTVGLRPIIAELHSSQPTVFPHPNLRDIKAPYEDNQSRNGDNLEVLALEYHRLTLK